ncbi:hypothetical protein GO495_11770 [Chitinophaga oryziterrae]|uniref:LamG domain-containing protein n=1 Tax=Chitinophaga oryziterrae TaxID=1031224 RepID=A0A6N8J832_9BACT|nr:hypothetical protein [Chitinophaga oryziterrae]MVT41263.1 hypothetical protein [Chitinophaga oryziterrae]
MKRSILYITLLLAFATSAIAQTITVDNAIWMPKSYLDARKQHPPEDSFWKSVDFSKYLSPISSLRILSDNVSIYTYGAEYFPVHVSKEKVLPDRKVWQLDRPIFNGGQSSLFEDASFTLISHNDKKDLWLGIANKEGRTDSVQFEKVPKEKAGTPLWMHTNNYLAYYFRGKRFDVYDENGKLLYNNMQTNANGNLSGLPGYNAWTITSGSTFQLTSNKQGVITFSGFTVTFNGADVVLHPQQKEGLLSKPLILKEKK